MVVTTHKEKGLLSISCWDLGNYPWQYSQNISKNLRFKILDKLYLYLSFSKLQLLTDSDNNTFV